MKTRFFLFLFLVAVFVSCEKKGVSTIDSMPVIHDIYVNDTDFETCITWMNGNSGSSDVAPERMEITIPSGEKFSQTYTYETVDDLNLLFSGVSIQVSFDNQHAFSPAETQSSVDFWSSLPHTKKEKLDNKEEYTNTFFLSDILTLMGE